MTGPWNFTEAQRRQFREAHAEAKERAMASKASPKRPTPQGISRLLADAGFTRAVQTSRATLRHSFTSGFRVTKDRDNERAVRVRHTFASKAASLSSELHKAKLAAYAKTITEAGWAVETGEYELTVTARKDERR